MVIKKKIYLCFFLFIALNNKKIDSWSCILNICTWGSALWCEHSGDPGALTLGWRTCGVHRRAQLDGRCHPPKKTLMNLRAHDFTGSCSQCDQVVLKAAPSPPFPELGGCVACLRLHSGLMAELGCDSLALSVLIRGYWKLFKGISYSVECLWPKSQGTKHLTPTKWRLGNALLPLRELHLSSAGAGLGSGWGGGTVAREYSWTTTFMHELQQKMMLSWKTQGNDVCFPDLLLVKGNPLDLSIPTFHAHKVEILNLTCLIALKWGQNEL